MKRARNTPPKAASAEAVYARESRQAQRAKDARWVDADRAKEIAAEEGIEHGVDHLRVALKQGLLCRWQHRQRLTLSKAVVEMRMTIRDVAIHQRGEARWAQVPAKPQLDHNDTPIRDRTTGKIQYVTIFEFDDKRVRDAFSTAVIRAVLAFEPGAFADAEASAAIHLDEHSATNTTKSALRKRGAGA